MALDFTRQDVLTADVVEDFLRQNEIPVRTEKGGTCEVVGLPFQVELIGSFTSCDLSG